MIFLHEFEDEEGNEVDLTEITYDVIRTFVDLVPGDASGYPGVPRVTVFTHRVRINSDAVDPEEDDGLHS